MNTTVWIYRYRITFINDNGDTIVREVDARHSFEAIQLAGAFGKTVISIINLDL